MKTVTIESLPAAKKIEKRIKIGKRRGTGGSGSPGRGDGGGGGFTERPEKDDLGKLRLSVVLLLLMLGVFSVMLAGAYVRVSLKSSTAWRPFAFPFQLWIGTALLAASSLVFRRAVRSFRGGFARGGKLLRAALLCGGLFLGAEISTGFELVRRNVRFVDNPYAIFVYVSMALCGALLLGGLAGIVWFLFDLRKPETPAEEDEKRRSVAAVIGWYWHFSVILWIGLFSLLQIWK